MSVVQLQIEMSVQDMQKIFGAGDSYVRKLENDLDVTIVDRNGKIIITGEEKNANRACRILSQLTEISKRGNEIEEQSVNYAITLSMEDKEEVLTEIDSDIICHTINGKPIKPKTLGQKKYVDTIREKLIDEYYQIFCLILCKFVHSFHGLLHLGHQVCFYRHTHLINNDKVST